MVGLHAGPAVCVGALQTRQDTIQLEVHTPDLPSPFIRHKSIPSVGTKGCCRIWRIFVLIGGILQVIRSIDWSWPNIITASLIMRKQVDWSLLKSGWTVPVDVHKRVVDENDGVELQPRDKRHIVLLIDGHPFGAMRYLCSASAGPATTSYKSDTIGTTNSVES